MYEHYHDIIQDSNSLLATTSLSTTISIGICTSNDEYHIYRLLKNLVKVFTQGELNVLEIIIVSSGCKDRSEIIINKFIDKYPEKIILITETNRKGKSSALNLILGKYRGDALILIPADVYIFIKSLKLLKAKLISSSKIGIVSGKPIVSCNQNELNTTGKMVDLLWRLHNHTLNLTDNTHATGEIMIIKRNTIAHIPEFVINDDAYMALEIIHKKFKIAHEEKATVVISIPTNLRSYIIQRKRVILGHKQLGRLRNEHTTTLKQLFKTDKKRAIKILLLELKNTKNIPYFILASLIEFYIEINLFFSKNHDFDDYFVWNRVETTNFT